MKVKKERESRPIHGEGAGATEECLRADAGSTHGKRQRQTNCSLDERRTDGRTSDVARSAAAEENSGGAACLAHASHAHLANVLLPTSKQALFKQVQQLFWTFSLFRSGPAPPHMT